MNLCTCSVVRRLLYAVAAGVGGAAAGVGAALVALVAADAPPHARPSREADLEPPIPGPRAVEPRPTERPANGARRPPRLGARGASRGARGARRRGAYPHSQEMGAADASDVDVAVTATGKASPPRPEEATPRRAATVAAGVLFGVLLVFAGCALGVVARTARRHRSVVAEDARLYPVNKDGRDVVVRANEATEVLKLVPTTPDAKLDHAKRLHLTLAGTAITAAVTGHVHRLEGEEALRLSTRVGPVVVAPNGVFLHDDVKVRTPSAHAQRRVRAHMTGANTARVARSRVAHTVSAPRVVG